MPRALANGRLDQVCTMLGDRLYLAVRKDRTDSRWIQFFNRQTTSQFVRQPLALQINAVKAWLTLKDDL
jgi:hypothetical protein